MRKIFQTLANAALVVGGFFIVLFSASRLSNSSNQKSSAPATTDTGVAHADGPNTYTQCAPPPPSCK